MLAKFFVDRPIFAWVISIVITGGGLVAALVLPIAQYPEISPPTVSVSANYPGANAKVVADTVAAPIEQQVNGVERMLYMSSTCANDGSYNLTVTFELGTDLNMAQVLVQNRVNLATAQLPEEVQRQGLNVKKKSPNILMVVNLYSPDRSREQLYLSNYLTIQIKDEIARLNGVGDIALLGQQDYSMRAWLDPDKVARNGLTAADVVNAVKQQNVQVAAGQIGQEPVPDGQAFQLTVSTLGRLVDVEQFETIVVKSGGTGADGVTRPAVLLKDVGRVELTAKSEDIRNTMDGGPAVGLAVFALPGANALAVADRVEAKMKQLKKRFPSGVDFAVRYDTTPFIKQSIEEVFSTLRDAIILVALVVLFFLQDWRAMILPMIDVPVALTGTFAVMYALGFSMNNLTLFGLVLAIGIVVDDAIVVLENIERWIAMGHDARTATIGAMGEITGPIIAITLVLSSVFLPSALLPGITGEFYRQFALTISAAMIISAINAMTMTPARAVSIFKGHEHKPGEAHDPSAAKEALPWWGTMFLFGLGSLYILDGIVKHKLGLVGDGEGATQTWAEYGVQAAVFVPGALVGYLIAARLNWVLGRVFRGFNAVFTVLTKLYGRAVAGLLRVFVIVLVVYGGLLFLTYKGTTTTPVGFVPLQDKGYLLVNVQLPDAASVQRTTAVMAQLDDILLGPVVDPATGARDKSQGVKGVGHTVGIAGQSVLLGANAPNYGTMFVILDPFEVRKGDLETNGFEIMFIAQDKFRREVQDAMVAVFPPPPVDGLGVAGGFKVMIENRGDLSPPELEQVTNGFIAELVQNKSQVTGAFTQFRSGVPQLYADIDRTKCRQLGVQLSDVFNTLQVYLGGAYVNDFNQFGRTWQVNLKADAPFRVTADYVKNLKVKNDKGDMVPLGAVAKIEDATGPVFVQRYNLYPAAAVAGSLSRDTSSGQGIAIVEAAAEKSLPKQAAYDWTELFYLQMLEGSAAVYAFLGAVILVYLVLAAQFESWALPFAIILVVPMCVLSSLIGVRLVGLSMDIFVQVGFIVLVGLAAKNAILIVEFAEQSRKGGMPLKQAVIHAVEQRLRPIVMTSFAFILGVVPLVLAEGAGSEMRKTLGIAVFSGMIGVTAFGLLLTPVFAYAVGRLKPDTPPPAERTPPTHPEPTTTP
ncbi:MAG: efflux RND transporter permease subunit [Fimbriiglobus sp.]